MRSIIFFFILICSIFIIVPTRVFADPTCSGGQLCTTLGDGTPYCQPVAGCSNPTGACTCTPGYSYTCPYNGGFAILGSCGPAQTAPPPPPAPTSTPASSGLTLSPNHGCLNTPIKATLGTTEDPAIGYFNNNRQAGASGFLLVDGFPSWINNAITIVPNQTMQYGLPPTGPGEGGELIAQVSNYLDYSALSNGSAAYPITFTFAGNSPQPPNVTAMYTVDASCLPTTQPTTAPIPTPTNTPVPTHTPTPTNTPTPTATATPSCHMVQICPTGPNGTIQLCTFTCE